MKVVKSIQLFFQEGTSDKVYNASIVEESPGVFTLHVEWGRRGGPLQRGTKAVKASLAKAESELQKVVREKTKKGYEEMTASVQPAPVAPPVGQGSGSKTGAGGRKKIGQGAQLLNSCDDREVEALLRDDGIVAQQKLDGARVLVHVGAEVVATNRSGQVTALADGVLGCLGYLARGTILDGELVQETRGPCFYLFDLLQHGTDDLREAGYLDRYLELDVVVDQIDGPVRLVPLARTEGEKRELLERLRSERAEGIVFKRIDAPYVQGRPPSGGAQLKYKFTKTADVLIVENAGNAYAMAVLDADGNERRVGKVFAGTTNEIRAALDARIGGGERLVAEVAYLYATEEDQLFQPVFLRVREDKDPDECSLDQLVRTSRKVVDGPAKKRKK
jgi:bifunctional non-homologous end joining protein LigD